MQVFNRSSESKSSKPQIIISSEKETSILTQLDILNDFISKRNFQDSTKTLQELRKKVIAEFQSSKENIPTAKPKDLQSDLDDSRKAFKQLYDQYQVEILKLKKDSEEKSKEILKLNQKIKDLESIKCESLDYIEIFKQCQSLEVSMSDMNKKCDLYYSKMKTQDILISELLSKNTELALKNKELTEKILRAETDNRNIIASFEKNLLTKAQDFKEKTLNILSIKSPRSLGSKSVDPTSRTASSDYSSPKQAKTIITIQSPPTFQNLHKFSKKITDEELLLLKLKLSSAD